MSGDADPGIRTARRCFQCQSSAYLHGWWAACWLSRLCTCGIVGRPGQSLLQVPVAPAIRAPMVVLAVVCPDHMLTLELGNDSYPLRIDHPSARNHDTSIAWIGKYCPNRIPRHSNSQFCVSFHSYFLLCSLILLMAKTSKISPQTIEIAFFELYHEEYLHKGWSMVIGQNQYVKICSLFMCLHGF